MISGLCPSSAYRFVSDLTPLVLTHTASGEKSPDQYQWEEFIEAVKTKERTEHEIEELKRKFDTKLGAVPPEADPERTKCPPLRSGPELHLDEEAIKRFGLPTDNFEDIKRFALPADEDLNRILRYEASIQRQLVHAINPVERSQRTRKGEQVPAPVNIQLSNDQ